MKLNKILNNYTFGFKISLNLKNQIKLISLSLL